jgi:hypothetical protein
MSQRRCADAGTNDSYSEHGDPSSVLLAINRQLNHNRSSGVKSPVYIKNRVFRLVAESRIAYDDTDIDSYDGGLSYLGKL